jgi:hypothetical protein
MGLLLVTALACKPKPPPPVVRTVYSGPLLSTPDLMARLAENAAPLRTLWARHDFAVSFLDKNDRVRTFDGDGVLLIRKPSRTSPPRTPVEIRLQGSKDIVGPVFDLGANRDRAWLTLLADIDALYWLPQPGAAVDDPAEESGESLSVPIRPDLVADVLGIADLPTDLTRFPSPVVRFDEDADAYRVLMVESAADETHLAASRELVADRASLRITQVNVYGRDGRLILRSDLSGHRAVSESVAALVPTDIVLTMPQSRATMRLILRGMQPTRNNLPSDISFRFPDPPPVSNVVRLSAGNP